MDQDRIVRLASRNTSAVVADGEQDGVIEVSHNWDVEIGDHTIEMSRHEHKTGIYVSVTTSDPTVPDSEICLAFSPRQALAISDALRSVAAEVTARTILGAQADDEDEAKA